jgi:hypothetical protein
MEINREHPVMVPYDFTPVSNVALAHASHYCQISARNLIILNIVDESTQNFLKHHNEIDEFLHTKLEEISKNTSEKYKINARYIVKKGKIISIRKIAQDLGISFMFIGIDQPQRQTSKVLKVIGSSPSPVYIVQGNVDWKPINTIIFPVDDFEETRQKIGCTLFLAKLTNSIVKLFSVSLSDRNAELSQEVRVKQIEKLLQENQIPFTTEYAKRHQKEFAEELLEYAQMNNVDVMILMKTPRIFLPNVLIRNIDKRILLNSLNIPSIYINARDVGTYH